VFPLKAGTEKETRLKKCQRNKSLFGFGTLTVAKKGVMLIKYYRDIEFTTWVQIVTVSNLQGGKSREHLDLFPKKSFS
jgi:hypothetical protein